MHNVRIWSVRLAAAALVFTLGMSFTSHHVFAMDMTEIPASIDIQQKMVDQLGIQDEEILGFYYSSMTNSTDARKHNINKAMGKIDDLVIMPLQEFSFNGQVGNSNLAEDGWQKAGVLQNGQLIDDFGGGICQVSSTLYNAANDAGMTMVERHNHSKSVGYVPAGEDATVAYGYMDFRFSNPYDFPVKIKAQSYENEEVAIAIIRA